jgi:hypothetical protein
MAKYCSRQEGNEMAEENAMVLHYCFPAVLFM